MSVFVDASAFYALLNKKDKFYEKAISVAKVLSDSNELLITSNYTLAETYTVVRSKINFNTARAFISEIRRSEIEIIWIDEETHNRGVEIFIEKKEPKDLSFFDCVDFALIERYGIKKAFSFDRHFKLLKIPILGME